MMDLDIKRLHLQVYRVLSIKESSWGLDSFYKISRCKRKIKLKEIFVAVQFYLNKLLKVTAS